MDNLPEHENKHFPLKKHDSSKTNREYVHCDSNKCSRYCCHYWEFFQVVVVTLGGVVHACYGNTSNSH